MTDNREIPALPEKDPGKPRRGISASVLKLIAIAAMTVDHFTWAFFPGTQKVWYVLILHAIGRLTAPIMWFFIAEGMHYTHNRRRYIFRLFLFAILSHFAYNFAFGIPFLPFSRGSVFNQTGVMWALALSALLIALSESEKIPKVLKYVCIFACCLLAFPADWSSIAVMAPVFLYMHRGNFKKQAIDIVFWTFIYALVYFFFIDKLYGAWQMFTALSVPLLALYNGARGGGKSTAAKFAGKWFFYIYYPAHLIAVGIVRLCLHGDVPIIFD